MKTGSRGLKPLCYKEVTMLTQHDLIMRELRVQQQMQRQKEVQYDKPASKKVRKTRKPRVSDVAGAELA
jgi:hypothetical protein